MSTFLFGIHCHQPVDNFGEAVFEAIERSYLPLFRVLSRFEDFRFSVHFSGWLLEKIATEVPELFSLMKTMSARKQIEWLGRVLRADSRLDPLRRPPCSDTKTFGPH